MKRLKLRIHGRVQGVGFRYFVLRGARQLDVAGIVRNTRDGSVEVVAEGASQALEELAEMARQGPPASHVTRVDEEWSEGHGNYEGFDIDV